MNPLITLDNVSLRSPLRPILHEINLSIGEREIVTVIGPNGAGKSSLIKLIAGLRQPSAGVITRHQDIRLGYMPQRLSIDGGMPISVSRFLSLAKPCHKARQAVLSRLSIQALNQTPMNQLSGGELQRVLLARAILRQPTLLLLDEPLQGVDMTGQASLYALIEQLRTELGCAIVMISHDLHLVMAKTDTVICLNRHICCQGRPENVSAHPEYLQLFGHQAADRIAVYAHHHDHEHAIQGDIIECQTHKHSHKETGHD